MSFDNIDVPAEYKRILLRTLHFHIGKNKAIPRSDLLEKLKMMGWETNDRTMRSQINLLRKQGALICSCGGHGGGYYLARNWNELDDYIGQELRPRAMDLLEQEKALKTGARREWGENSSQLDLPEFVVMKRRDPNEKVHLESSHGLDVGW